MRGARRPSRATSRSNATQAARSSLPIALVRENEVAHARAAEDARRAGATRMVVPSVSLTKKSPYEDEGALERSMEGGEAAKTTCHDTSDVTSRAEIPLT